MLQPLVAYKSSPTTLLWIGFWFSFLHYSLSWNITTGIGNEIKTNKIAVITESFILFGSQVMAKNLAIAEIVTKSVNGK